jgi:imidazolonepropionase-like amidohydrolase
MRFRVLVSLCLALGATTPVFAADTVVVEASKLYPSPDTPAVANGVVLIRGGKIVAAGDRKHIKIPRNARSSTCSGVVVAGFQNSHVHFTEDAWSGADKAPADRLNQRLQAMLTRYGFTTVFDTGSDQANTIALRNRINRGELTGPRIFTAGLPLYPPDGIPHYINDLPRDVLARMHQPRDEQQAREDVRANLAAGADGTKLFMVTSPKHDAFTKMAPDVAKAAVDETHRHHKLVLAHPTSVEGIRNALAAGVDILVHTTLAETVPWDEVLLRQMVAQDMAVMPTFKLWRYELQKAQVPADVTDRLVSATQTELKVFAAAGGQVLFGTDVGYMHQYDPTDEYLHMAQAGLTPMQILASLTTAPAQRWKEADRRGRVAPNLDADLVVLAGDPADDVANFAKVRCTFRGGALVYQAASGT